MAKEAAMSEDRTPRTISLTELNDEGVEEARSRNRRRRKDRPRDEDIRLERPEREGSDRVQDMDPRDQARLTVR